MTPTECPACNGPGVLLGTLGSRSHFRCRDCGLDFSAEVERCARARCKEPAAERTLEHGPLCEEHYEKWCVS